MLMAGMPMNHGAAEKMTHGGRFVSKRHHNMGKTPQHGQLGSGSIAADAVPNVSRAALKAPDTSHLQLEESKPARACHEPERAPWTFFTVHVLVLPWPVDSGTGDTISDTCPCGLP